MHDVIVLFTDGEESDLLGAAAFVREHPWAKDAAMVLNFEARGTSGRSLMFETGPSNLDTTRVLRTVPRCYSRFLVHYDLPHDAERHGPVGARATWHACFNLCFW